MSEMNVDYLPPRQPDAKIDAGAVNPDVLAFNMKALEAHLARRQARELGASALSKVQLELLDDDIAA